MSISPNVSTVPLACQQPQAAGSSTATLRLYPPNSAEIVALSKDPIGPGWAPLAVGVRGSFTAVESRGLEVVVGGRAFYAKWSPGKACVATVAGLHHDVAAAESWGCFALRQADPFPGHCRGADCGGWVGDGTSSGGVAVAAPVSQLKLKLGQAQPGRFGAVLAPERGPEPEAALGSGEPLRAADERLVSLVNGGAQLWKASLSALPPHLARSSAGAGWPSGLPPDEKELRPMAPAAELARGAAEESLDWRNRTVGSDWLGPMRLAAAAAASPAGRSGASLAAAAAVLSMVEARTSIASAGAQAESLSLASALACGSESGGATGDEREAGSAYLFARQGEELGYERESCVPWPSTDAGSPRCASLRRCANPLRRRVRRTWYVGGHLGNCSEAALIAELQRGPLVVGLHVSRDFHLYRSGVYHELQRDYWRRMLGRSSPRYEPSTCHSGCRPPDKLEYEATTHHALLVGYGVERGVPGYGDAPYWIVAPGWGEGWGVGGYARVLRGEMSAEFLGVAADPMV